MRPLLLLSFLLALLPGKVMSQGESTNTMKNLQKKLEIEAVRFGQLEVGGPSAGVEFHRQSGLPSRISLFNPVANSLEVPFDFWQRYKSKPFRLWLTIGDRVLDLGSLAPESYKLTPFSVSFFWKVEEIDISVSYRFCKTLPAFAVSTTLINNSKTRRSIDLTTGLDGWLRTSSSYDLKDKAWTTFSNQGNSILWNFVQPETASASVFVVNAGILPSSFSTRGPLDQISSQSADINSPDGFTHALINKDAPEHPVAWFKHKLELPPQKPVTTVQLIGSCKQGEFAGLLPKLLSDYQKDIEEYEASVLDWAVSRQTIETNDSSLNHSIRWASAILQTNAHFLDNELLPMPCTAEYNFFFSHDVLVTDLARVFFDPARVRKDLEFIAKLTGPDKIIPHAYYWKNSKYVTEFVTDDGWNHQWFVIISARYLRHTNDRKLVEKLFPLIEESCRRMLINRKEDSLVWANRPDWWDIGGSAGPRAYMTILSLQALKEYIGMCSFLGKNLNSLAKLEQEADQMQKSLSTILWDEKDGYLMNRWKGMEKDPHFYIGSLLAGHFGLLSQSQMERQVLTAKQELLVPDVGILNAAPMDFHTLKKDWEFEGDQAGAPHYYMNGGIWPQGNAWYALSLMENGAKQEALDFLKSIMTLEGIMKGPNGQPAMYEVRNSNSEDPDVFGTVDKPQFLWAAGWLLYSCYHLFCVHETPWNLVFDPFLPAESKGNAHFSFLVGGKTANVELQGNGKQVKQIHYGAKAYPSLVIPEDLPDAKIRLELGFPDQPMLTSLDAILASCSWDTSSSELVFVAKAFPGHNGYASFVSPIPLKSVWSQNSEQLSKCRIQKTGKLWEIQIPFELSKSEEAFRLRF
jgi:hypothetical protein